MLKVVSNSQPLVRLWTTCWRSSRRNFLGVTGVKVLDVNKLYYKPDNCFHSSSLTYAKKKQKRKPINVRKRAIALNATGEVCEIFENMTIQDIADAMQKDLDHVFEVLLYIPNTDELDSPDSVVNDIHITKEILKKSGFRYQMKASLKKTKPDEDKDVYPQPPAEVKHLIKRPPVVTIMGHVDHGKTTLLDSLRQSKIVDQEFGGITQHIGAFSVKMTNTGESITFLDTPGHAAFSAMRERGARVTDLVVLVVAADDGVMEQTIESIRYAKEANVPLLVAINKIDKPESDIERTKKMLLGHGVQLEDFGGDVQSVEISALKDTNIIGLQEAIITLAELSDIKASRTGFVEGAVIESCTDPGRGKLATVLIQRGTLKKGSYITAGKAWAKVRAIFDDSGLPIQRALPGSAVEVIGWRELPAAGDYIIEVQNEKRAREVMNYRLAKLEVLKAEKDHIVIQDKQDKHKAEYQAELKLRRSLGFFKYLRKKKTKETVDTKTGPWLPIVIKGDVDGSVEAILDSLDTYDSSKCTLDVISYGVGLITEKDIELASSFDGIVYGFNVEIAKGAMDLSRQLDVPIKSHNVIYKLIDDLKNRLEERLPPVKVENTLGEANILQLFHVKDGKRKLFIAGCRCIKGTLLKKEYFKVIRDDEEVYEGTISSLKHFKNEVESIKVDVECGIKFSDNDFEPIVGDKILCFNELEKPDTIDWETGF